MQLWIYSPYEHIPIGVIDNYSGLVISHKAIKPGDIEFECKLSDTSRLLQTDAIVWPQGDETAYFVTTCTKRTEATGEEVVAVRGHCLKWLLNQRALALRKIYQGRSGAVMAQMLQEISSSGKRAFPRFTWDIPAQLGSEITMEATADSYLSNFEDICAADGLTMRVLWNSTARTLVLQAYAGIDRSVGNGEGNVPILFDETLETMSGIEYIQSTADSRNVMYISDSDDAVLEAGDTDSAGYERFEDAMTDSGGREVSNADGSTTTLTDDQYRQKKLELALKELDRARPIRSATGDLPPSEQMIAFGVDYRLGDVVTVRKTPWDMNVNVRITEENLREKNGTPVRQLTIGSPLPTIAERIKMR